MIMGLIRTMPWEAAEHSALGHRADPRIRISPIIKADAFKPCRLYLCSMMNGLDKWMQHLPLVPINPQSNLIFGPAPSKRQIQMAVSTSPGTGLSKFRLPMDFPWDPYIWDGCWYSLRTRYIKRRQSLNDPAFNSSSLLGLFLQSLSPESSDADKSGAKQDNCRGFRDGGCSVASDVV